MEFNVGDKIRCISFSDFYDEELFEKDGKYFLSLSYSSQTFDGEMWYDINECFTKWGSFSSDMWRFYKLVDSKWIPIPIKKHVFIGRVIRD